MSASQLRQTSTTEQVAAIVAHEMGHLIARHSAERFSHQQLSSGFEKMFGFSSLCPDLRAVQELEADHIGLILMAETGFDAQSAIGYLTDQVAGNNAKKSRKKLRPPILVDEWSGHPSVSTF